jgi:hypothetical protein
MKFQYDEVVGITEIQTDTSDICIFCKYYDFCPFLGAIENNVVYPSASYLEIDDCPMYAPYIEEASEN